MPKHNFRLALAGVGMVAAISCLAFIFPIAEQNASDKDSELTLLMRNMYADAANMRAAVKKRQKPVPAVPHEQILTAAASDPEKIASPTYTAFAQAYLKALDALQEGAPKQRPALYKALIDQCMDCHTSFCPGPKMLIKNLY